MDRFNGAEAAVRMLQLYGVRHIFGLCGDTSLPFYDALYRMEHGIKHVLTRDELLESLRVTIGEALAMNRADAKQAAGKGYEELTIAV